MTMESKPPFWLVWNPEGFPPEYRHRTYKAARTEAERRARTNPGQSFYVLCPVAMGVKSDVMWRHYLADAELAEDEIPF